MIRSDSPSVESVHFCWQLFQPIRPAPLHQLVFFNIAFYVGPSAVFSDWRELLGEAFSGPIWARWGATKGKMSRRSRLSLRQPVFYRTTGTSHLAPSRQSQDKRLGLEVMSLVSPRIPQIPGHCQRIYSFIISLIYFGANHQKQAVLTTNVNTEQQSQFHQYDQMRF